jgi:hypothetical protein
VIFMPLQNWPAAVPPPVAADGAVVAGVVVVVAAVVPVAVMAAVAPAVAVALLLPQAVTTIANAASTSGNLEKDLDIPIALLNVTMELTFGRRAPLHRGRNDLLLLSHRWFRA